MDWGYDIDNSFVMFKPEEVENRFFLLKFDYDAIYDDSIFRDAFFREKDGELTDVKFLISKKLAKKIRNMPFLNGKTNKRKFKMNSLKNVKKKKKKQQKN